MKNNKNKRTVVKFASLKTKKTIICTSYLMRDVLYLLEFNDNVTDYSRTDATLLYPVNRVTNIISFDLEIYCKNKNQLALITNKPAKIPISIISNFCFENEFEFKFCTKCLIPKQILENIKHLYRYASQTITFQHQLLINKIFKNTDFILLDGLIKVFKQNGLNHADIYTLLYHKFIRADLTKPLDFQTIIKPTAKIRREFISRRKAMFKLSLLFTSILIVCFSLISVSARCPNPFPYGKVDEPYKKTVLFPKDTIMKVSLDNSVGTDKYKTGDIVQFTVLENVFGVTLPDKSSIQDGQENLGTIDELKETFKNQHLKIIIPKETIGFGRVARVKNRVPFINFKADIRIVLDYVIIDSGECIPVELTYTVDERIPISPKKRYPRTLSSCKNRKLDVEGALCIKGKRPPYNVASVVTTLIAAGVLGIFKNETTDILAGSTVIAETTEKGSISDLVNGLQAIASEEFIYEVKTTKNRIVHIKSESDEDEEPKP